MTVGDLIERLEMAKDSLPNGGESEVMLAHQPNWPLRFHIQSVAVIGHQKICPDCEERYLEETPEGWRCPGKDCGAEVDKDDLEESSDNAICWIVEGGQPYDNPYGPRAAWEEENAI